ncbi:hypothetical protein PR048_000277 [Dryococelus australis]|uniref:Uncharacterized protein n=1 Tax=Dryococelus australis TaxID=614101 RepID=A0ABQ9IFD5_9NEOP|nr:hypothetical protein PR048_000277 [Dryococelus australis]
MDRDLKNSRIRFRTSWNSKHERLYNFNNWPTRCLTSRVQLSSVTGDSQCAVDIGIFVHKTVEEVSVEQLRDSQGQGEREKFKETRRQASSLVTISTCENPGATPTGDRTWFAYVGGEQSNHYTTAAPGGWDVNTFRAEAPVIRGLICWNYTKTRGHTTGWHRDAGTHDGVASRRGDTRRGGIETRGHTPRWHRDAGTHDGVASRRGDTRRGGIETRGHTTGWHRDAGTHDGVASPMRAYGIAREMACDEVLQGKLALAQHCTHSAYAAGTGHGVILQTFNSKKCEETGPRNFANSFEDKLEFTHAYIRLPFSSGLLFVSHALDEFKPITSLQENKDRIPCLLIWAKTGLSVNKQQITAQVRKGLWRIAYDEAMSGRLLSAARNTRRGEGGPHPTDRETRPYHGLHKQITRKPADAPGEGVDAAGACESHTHAHPRRLTPSIDDDNRLLSDTSVRRRAGPIRKPVTPQNTCDFLKCVWFPLATRRNAVRQSAPSNRQLRQSENGYAHIKGTATPFRFSEQPRETEVYRVFLHRHLVRRNEAAPSTKRTVTINWPNEKNTVDAAVQAWPIERGTYLPNTLMAALAMAVRQIDSLVQYIHDVLIVSEMSPGFHSWTGVWKLNSLFQYCELFRIFALIIPAETASSLFGHIVRNEQRLDEATLQFLSWWKVQSFAPVRMLDSTVMCILEPQMFVHWPLPHGVDSVTSHLAVWHWLVVSLLVCYELRVVQGVSNELRSNCKDNFSVHVFDVYLRYRSAQDIVKEAIKQRGLLKESGLQTKRGSGAELSRAVKVCNPVLKRFSLAEGLGWKRTEIRYLAKLAGSSNTRSLTELTIILLVSSSASPQQTALRSKELRWLSG